MSSLARRILARLHPARYVRDADYRREQQHLVSLGIGGFCLMDGTLNDVMETIGALQHCTQERLIFAIDAETGLGMRLDNAVEFPHAFALGRCRLTTTESVSSAIALQLRSLGIQWNFAPVCDVHTNVHNPIIGIRTFAMETPTVVAHATTWIKAHQRMGVASCAKHFPGHGDVTADSHRELPVILHDMQRLASVELVPFYAAIKEGVASIMVGHLAVPALDPSREPASLSAFVIRNFLRERLGYNGVIVTDALDMHPITSRHSSGAAVVEAFRAGADIALMPQRALEAMEYAQHALICGQISAEEHSAALERIEQIAAMGVGEPSVGIALGEHANLALQAALEALSIAGDSGALPLDKYGHIAAFAVVHPDDNLTSPTAFFRYLGQLFEGDMDVAFINNEITNTDIESYVEATQQAECLIVAVFERPRAEKSLLESSPALTEALRRLGEQKRCILVLLGNPLVSVNFDAELVVRTYSDSDPSCAAAALVLTRDRAFQNP